MAVAIKIRYAHQALAGRKSLRVSSEENVPVEVDGELIGNCPVEFQMGERTLRVLAPA